VKRAIVIGSGPNGLSAAVVLAQAGLRVEVYEAEDQPGGAARTMELTLPGFRHDFGSSVYPLGAGSPFFRTLPLAELGLEWIHGEACVAHPFDDGSAVTLEHSFAEQEQVLGTEDGSAWTSLMRPASERWWDFAEDALKPPLHIPRHPLLMARFSAYGVLPADVLARRFRTERARALLAGLVGHSLLSFNQLMTSAVGLLFGASAVAVGWPIAKGGAQSIPDALIRRLQQFGGAVYTGRRIDSLDELDTRDAVILCDVTPVQLLRIAGPRLLPDYRRTLQRYVHGPGAFKIDYALSQPIPWKAPDCMRAMTIHVGGTYDEIAAGERAVWEGGQAERPFVLVTQPSLFDRIRAPEGKHTAWAYCHVPYGAVEDRTRVIEDQIERFAPGFRDCVLARRTWSPADLQARNANLHGGDINAGAFTLRQIILRPGIRSYRTGTPGLYLCSAATPPGGGVHGMCGYSAAQAALRDLRLA
jgi:phytoene dehydrogenase-like protein